MNVHVINETYKHMCLVIIFIIKFTLFNTLIWTFAWNRHVRSRVTIGVIITWCGHLVLPGLSTNDTPRYSEYPLIIHPRDNFQIYSSNHSPPTQIIQRRRLGMFKIKINKSSLLFKYHDICRNDSKANGENNKPSYFKKILI